MKPQEWRQQLGERVRDLFRSPEMEQFYSVPLTLERARIYLLQLGSYVRQRRNFWPQVAANCPEFEVKQRIMEHEYEELVEDEFSKAGKRLLSPAVTVASVWPQRDFSLLKAQRSPLPVATRRRSMKR